MNLYRVLPPPSEAIAFHSGLDREAFLPHLVPPRLPWVRAVMVTNSAGHTEGPTGTSAGLTRGADRALLGLYRKSADVVFTGAQTVRAEPVPVPATTPLCVVTRSGNLGDHRITSGPGRSLFVVTTEQGAKRVSADTAGLDATVIALDGEGPFDAAAIIHGVSGHVSMEHILVEGGRALWETFAPLTNEVCVSVAPPPTSTHQGIPEWWPGDSSQWTLASLMTDDQKMLYFRYETGVDGVATAQPDQPA